MRESEGVLHTSTSLLGWVYILCYIIRERSEVFLDCELELETRHIKSRSYLCTLEQSK